MRTRTAAAVAALAMGLLMMITPAGSAAADDGFPSTNDDNRDADQPHVNLVSEGPGTVTLEFVNPTYWLAFFEYRIDGETVGSTDHPIVTGDVIHPGVCVEGDVDFAPPCEPDVITRTFSADATVEVRLALGGERDWDFDWTAFAVGPGCRNGGWKMYGFRNQGQCIRFVNTGKDSR